MCWWHVDETGEPLTDAFILDPLYGCVGGSVDDICQAFCGDYAVFTTGGVEVFALKVGFDDLHAW